MMLLKYLKHDRRFYIRFISGYNIIRDIALKVKIYRGYPFGLFILVEKANDVMNGEYSLHNISQHLVSAFLFIQQIPSTSVSPSKMT